MNSQEIEEARFFLLLMEVLAGRRPPEDLLEPDLFQKRGLRICYCITRNTSYEPLDMFQDVCVRLLSFLGKYTAVNYSGKEISFEDVEAFFKFYVTIAGHLLTDYFRRDGKRHDQEVSLSENIAAALTIAAPGASPYEKCLISEFADSVRLLPESHLQALDLWNQGHSCEEIRVKLRLSCTKVTVRNWIMEALDNFERDSQSPKLKKRVGLKARRA